MSRRLLVVSMLFAALLFPAHRAHAQPMSSLGVAAGATVPVGNYGDFTEVGYHAMLVLDVHPPLSPLGFRLDGMFSELNFSDEVASSGKSRIWAGTANLVYNTGALGPYLIGGLGLYGTSISGTNVVIGTTRTETKLGINGGVGLRIPLTGFHAFIEARYHKVFDSDDDVAIVPLTFGVVF